MAEHTAADCCRAQYHPRVTDDGNYVARNRAQGWQVHHARDGVTTLTNQQFRIAMKLSSVATRTMDKGPRIEAQGDTLYYHHDNTIKEWWINSADKTEQWFRIERRPLTGNHELKVHIELDTDAVVSQSGNQLMFTTQQGQSIKYDRLQVWDSRGNTLPSRMQLADDQSSLALLVDDSQAHYPITIDPSFSQENYLKPPVVDAYDRFGTSIAIDDDTLVVGMPADASAATVINGDSSDNSAANAGSVYVFIRTGNDWVQQAYLKASNAEEGDSFGVSVTVSGNTVVVGAYKESGDVTAP